MHRLLDGGLDLRLSTPQVKKCLLVSIVCNLARVLDNSRSYISRLAVRSMGCLLPFLLVREKSHLSLLVIRVEIPSMLGGLSAGEKFLVHAPTFRSGACQLRIGSPVLLLPLCFGSSLKFVKLMRRGRIRSSFIVKCV